MVNFVAVQRRQGESFIVYSMWIVDINTLTGDPQYNV